MSGRRGGKFMLVYRPDGADVFAVSRLACSPERRVTAAEFSGDHRQAHAFAASLLARGCAVATAHADEAASDGRAYWKWGPGAPDRPAVESRRRERGDTTEKGRRTIESRAAASPLAVGCPSRSGVRVTRAEYDAYIASPRWREKRVSAIRRAKGRCQVCNGDQRINVHHRTYERLGDERPDDLMVLCRACHEIFHANGKLVELPA